MFPKCSQAARGGGGAGSPPTRACVQCPVSPIVPIVKRFAWSFGFATLPRTEIAGSANPSACGNLLAARKILRGRGDWDWGVEIPGHNYCPSRGSAVSPFTESKALLCALASCSWAISSHFPDPRNFLEKRSYCKHNCRAAKSEVELDLLTALKNPNWQRRPTQNCWWWKSVTFPRSSLSPRRVISATRWAKEPFHFSQNVS